MIDRQISSEDLMVRVGQGDDDAFEQQVLLGLAALAFFLGAHAVIIVFGCLVTVLSAWRCRDVRPAAHLLSLACPRESNQREGHPDAAPLRGP